MKTFEIVSEHEDYETEWPLLIVRGYNIDEHTTLEIQQGWCAGEPISDPCDDETVYMLDSGGILSTLLVLHNFGFEEA